MYLVCSVVFIPAVLAHAPVTQIVIRLGLKHNVGDLIAADACDKMLERLDHELGGIAYFALAGGIVKQGAANGALIVLLRAGDAGRLALCGHLLDLDYLMLADVLILERYVLLNVLLAVVAVDIAHAVMLGRGLGYYLFFGVNVV